MHQVVWNVSGFRHTTLHFVGGDCLFHFILLFSFGIVFIRLKVDSKPDSSPLKENIGHYAIHVKQNNYHPCTPNSVLGW